MKKARVTALNRPIPAVAALSCGIDSLQNFCACRFSPPGSWQHSSIQLSLSRQNRGPGIQSSDPLLPCGLLFCKGACFTGVEHLSSVDFSKKFDQFRDNASPASLVARSQARAVISVEVLVEQDVILPMRIGLKFLCRAVHWSPARLIAQEDPGKRLEISRATSNKFIKLPEPVGHSILNVSP
jgi:hypothetical protein